MKGKQDKAEAFADFLSKDFNGMPSEQRDKCIEEDEEIKEQVREAEKMIGIK